MCARPSWGKEKAKRYIYVFNPRSAPIIFSASSFQCKCSLFRFRCFLVKIQERKRNARNSLFKSQHHAHIRSLLWEGGCSLGYKSCILKVKVTARWEESAGAEIHTRSGCGPTTTDNGERSPLPAVTERRLGQKRRRALQGHGPSLTLHGAQSGRGL